MGARRCVLCLSPNGVVRKTVRWHTVPVCGDCLSRRPWRHMIVRRVVRDRREGTEEEEVEEELKGVKCE